jgi:AraC-like DNA-binding protein
VNSKLKNCQDWSVLARQANWSVKAMAKHCGVSSSSLRRQFLMHQGRAPRAWMDEERLRRAVELLRNSSSIKEAANLLGFKAFWGVCPSVFLASQAHGDAVPKRSKKINNG